jgi:septum formation protein
MEGSARRLVLASSSPSRLAVLHAAGLDPEAVASHVDEDGVDGLSPTAAVLVLAERKATAVADRLGPPKGDAAVVIGCDTMMSIAGTVRGKPSSAEEARSWWHSQRGRSGTLVTGHCVIDTASDRRAVDVAQTRVRFGTPSDEEIDAYLATGEPLHVAGGATIDGYGAPFIEHLDGDHGTVLGLSLPLLRRLLADLDIPITGLWR